MTELLLAIVGLIYIVFPIVVCRRLHNIENLLIVQNKYLAKLEEWHRYESDAKDQYRTPVDTFGNAPPPISPP